MVCKLMMFLGTVLLPSLAASRGLQASSNIVFVESIAGFPVSDTQQSAVGLQVAEGAAPTTTNSIQVETASGTAQYDMFFDMSSAPTGSTDFTVSFSAQLSSGEAWKVDAFSFESAGGWTPIGDLSNVDSNSWTSKDITFTQPAGVTFIEPTFSQILIRLYAAGTDQTGYLDFVSVVPGTSPVATTQPSTTPTAGTAGVVEYVNVVAGADILADQAGGAPLTTADEAAVTDSAKSIELSTTAAGAANFEFYMSAPSLPAGANAFEITLGVQLGNDANAADWKVAMFQHVGSADVLANGDLSAATGTGWSTVTVSLGTATPSNFVDATPQEVLVRLFTSGATSAQTIYLDYLSVVAKTGSAPAPTPQPAPAPAPEGGGVVEYVNVVTGADILADQAGGVPLRTADKAAVTDTSKSIELSTTAAGAGNFEFYVSAPPLLPAANTFKITLGAQLGSGANAADWQVAMFQHVGGFSDTVAGDLSGVTDTDWSTITVSLNTATPSNFIDPTPQEVLIRITTSGATSAQTLYLDYLSVVSSVTADVSSPTCGADYECPAGSTLDDPTATCAGITCADTDCCTEVYPAEVLVDMQPCIIAKQTIAKDVGNVAEAYLFNTFFKGFWFASQHIQAPPAATLDLTVNTDHGKCSAIYVGIVPTTAQRAQLEAYSRRFKVRVVYFDAADTANDPATVNRLCLRQRFGSPIEGPSRIRLTAAGGSPNSVVPPTLTSDPTEFSIFARPMAEFACTGGDGGVATVVAEYTDEDGMTLKDEDGNPSGAMVTWVGDDGVEEMHVFFSLAWFDMGSWAWAHHIVEWATKGIFQGERRFSLGGVVDDHFLSTGVFEFEAPEQTGPTERLTGDQMRIMAAAQDSLNAQYGASVFSDFAFNGLGILDKVESAYRAAGPNADIALLPKGQKPNPPEGIVPQLPVNWLANSVPGMAQEFPTWRAKDDLLDATISQAILDKFHWQSHTYSHLARDNLGQSDCDIEDGGNAQIAVITGMFDNDNYNWRSMTSPGITGLFNANCLASGAANLMRCYPGDNTYDGELTTVSLVNMESQFHSIYTTVATNGYAGAQIIPRFATNVYYNCVTTDCLIKENEKIRRDVCGCIPLNPNLPIQSCADCPEDDIQSFGTVEKLFKTEQDTTTRYILSGRRDKYMFHQANVIPTPTPTGKKSLLEYWYEVVFAKMAEFINTDSFPIMTFKFDDLCQNFAEHENLDGSNALVTATVEHVTGTVIGMTLATDGEAGTIPITVPTASASSVSLGDLTPYKTDTYGADTTYYVTTSPNAIPAALTKPDVSELAPVPAPVSPAENAADEAEQAADLKEAEPELKEQEKVAEEAAAEDEAIQNRMGFTNEILAKVTPEDENVLTPDEQAALDKTGLRR